MEQTASDRTVHVVIEQCLLNLKQFGLVGCRRVGPVGEAADGLIIDPQKSIEPLKVSGQVKMIDASSGNAQYLSAV